MSDKTQNKMSDVPKKLSDIIFWVLVVFCLSLFTILLVCIPFLDEDLNFEDKKFWEQVESLTKHLEKSLKNNDESVDPIYPQNKCIPPQNKCVPPQFKLYPSPYSLDKIAEMNDDGDNLHEIPKITSNDLWNEIIETLSILFGDTDNHYHYLNPEKHEPINIFNPTAFQILSEMFDEIDDSGDLGKDCGNSKDVDHLDEIIEILSMLSDRDDPPTIGEIIDEIDEIWEIDAASQKWKNKDTPPQLQKQSLSNDDIEMQRLLNLFKYQKSFGINTELIDTIISQKLSIQKAARIYDNLYIDSLKMFFGGLSSYDMLEDYLNPEKKLHELHECHSYILFPEITLDNSNQYPRVAFLLEMLNVRKSVSMNLELCQTQDTIHVRWIPTHSLVGTEKNNMSFETNVFNYF